MTAGLLRIGMADATIETIDSGVWRFIAACRRKVAGVHGQLVVRRNKENRCLTYVQLITSNGPGDAFAGEYFDGSCADSDVNTVLCRVAENLGELQSEGIAMAEQCLIQLRTQPTFAS